MFLPDTAWKKQDSSAMGLSAYGMRKHRAQGISDESQTLYLLLISNTGRMPRQATSFIQMKSRTIAPMIDMMKPAG
jgi:hypothetical protein